MKVVVLGRGLTEIVMLLELVTEPSPLIAWNVIVSEEITSTPFPFVLKITDPVAPAARVISC